MGEQNRIRDDVDTETGTRTYCRATLQYWSTEYSSTEYSTRLEVLPGTLGLGAHKTSKFSYITYIRDGDTNDHGTNDHVEPDNTVLTVDISVRGKMRTELFTYEILKTLLV